MLSAVTIDVKNAPQSLNIVILTSHLTLVSYFAKEIERMWTIVSFE